jgi:hypothetical protein
MKKPFHRAVTTASDSATITGQMVLNVLQNNFIVQLVLSTVHQIALFKEISKILSNTYKFSLIIKKLYENSH